jgi:hypothetical protein
MAQDNASQHEVRTGNGSPLYYQSEDASIILGRRKTKPHAIAVYRNSACVPERMGCRDLRKAKILLFRVCP